MERKININPESSETDFQIESFIYQDPESAKKMFELLLDTDKYQMATVYKEAFGGAPWFERFKCLNCEEFNSSNDICPNCNKQDFDEAYPIQNLVNEYFPEMISEFTPGILLIVKTGEQMLGFTTAGFVTLRDLIEKKYKGNAQILKSILFQSGLNPNSVMFYDNETCVRPEVQSKGVGSKLSQLRINLAKELGAKIICGRSINLPWLTLKEKQLRKAGYDFLSFVPDGDVYEVDGVKRQFYIANQL